MSRSGQGSSSDGGELSSRAEMTIAMPHPDAGDAGLVVGATIARYVVLEELGRGGMGRVLRAYDPRLQREVALKEVRGNALDAAAIRRLVAEARAMAKLSHANVVAIYDVEELPSGAVVLVMELVAGQTLAQWLHEVERPWSDVLERFEAAGRGLGAAHAAGLLHRDFKPGNVLVAPEGVVKVTDFGLAKVDANSVSAVGSRAGDEMGDDELTEAGTVMGTPRFMAPEQHRGEELSAASDQYAFCVSLWQALCGEPPFSGKTMATDKRKGPPAWPEASTPRPIADAIVRGLSPRPGDRWPSLTVLLDALAHDPRRRRNRWLLGLGGVVVVGLAVASYQRWANARAERCTGAEEGLAGTWDATRSAEVRAAIVGIDKPWVEPVWERTERELDDYAGAWVQMHTVACEATTVRGEQSPHMLDLRMACLHRAAVALGATVETLADADAEVVQRADELTSNLPPLSRCADTEALAADVEPPLAEEADAVEAVRAELARADSLEHAGRYDAAREAVDAAKALAKTIEYGPLHTEVALTEGTVLDSAGEYAAAEAALVDALDGASQWRQWDALEDAACKSMYVVGYQLKRMDEAMRFRPVVLGLTHGRPAAEAEARNTLAVILRVQGKYDQAEAEHRAALALQQQVLDPDHPDIASSRNNLAVVLYEQGRYPEAEAENRAALRLQERALGPRHPRVASTRANLANTLGAEGKFEEAEAENRAVLALRIEALGPDHPGVAASRNNLAAILFRVGKYEEAETEERAALAIRIATLGPEHLDVAEARSNLASILRARGKPEEAMREHRQALAVRTRILGPDHLIVAQSRNNLSVALAAEGRIEEAEAEARAAIAGVEKAVGTDHPDYAGFLSNFAGILAAEGKTKEAEAAYLEALEAEERALGPDHPSVAMLHANVAEFYLDAHRFTEALPQAERAWDLRRKDDTPPSARGRAAFIAARVLWSVPPPDRDRARARTLAQDAARSYRSAGPEYEGHVEAVEQWLGETAGKGSAPSSPR